MPDFGEKERTHIMKRKKYTDEPMEFELTEDFLPSPDKLILREDNVKVTLTLSKSSIKFFKKWATRKHGHYQTMIRKVLDRYVARYN